MHTLILSTRSRLQGHVKKKFLNIEYLESLQELVLRKIHLKLCNALYISARSSSQENVAVFC